MGIGYCSSIVAYDPDTRKEVPGIRVVPIDHNFNGVLEHNEQFYDSLDLMLRAMWTGQYPCHLDVDLYYITRLDAGNRLVKEYLKWVLDEGQNHLMSSGYIRLRSCDAGCQALLLD
jgi:phosphate transport system substrate-binding protein